MIVVELLRLGSMLCCLQNHPTLCILYFWTCLLIQHNYVDYRIIMLLEEASHQLIFNKIGSWRMELRRMDLLCWLLGEAAWITCDELDRDITASNFYHGYN